MVALRTMSSFPKSVKGHLEHGLGETGPCPPVNTIHTSPKLEAPRVDIEKKNLCSKKVTFSWDRAGKNKKGLENWEKLKNGQMVAFLNETLPY